MTKTFLRFFWTVIIAMAFGTAASAQSSTPGGVNGTDRSTQALPVQKRVLALYSFSSNPEVAQAETYRSVLSRGLQGRLDFYSEYIDAERVSDAKYESALRNYFRAKYSGPRFDVIIAAGTRAFKFVRRDRSRFDVPIVFSPRAAAACIPRCAGIVSLAAVDRAY